MTSSPDTTFPSAPKVLITSFGAFSGLDASKTNPSQLIASRLPSSLSHNGTEISLITPLEPLPAAYHAINSAIPKLIQDHDPDIIVHMGLATDQKYFSVEKSAAKEGYHEIPDVHRKVFTRAETKNLFGKGPARLETAFDTETAVSTVIRNLGSSGHHGKKGGQAKVKGKAVGPGPVDLRATDDVGCFVCGFVYYVSLSEMVKRGKKMNVVFLHCPLLETEEDIESGVRVAEELVKALVEEIL